MAFSGLGAGTLGDPFQITTPSQYMEMSNYETPSYFKLMNNIDLTSTSNYAIEAFASKLDGNGKTISVSFTNAGAPSYFFNIRAGSEVINTNFDLYLSGTVKYIFYIPNTSQTGIHIENVYAKMIREATNGYNTEFLNGPLDATSVVKHIVLEGSATKLFNGNVYPQVTDIYCNIQSVYCTAFLFTQLYGSLKRVYCIFNNINQYRNILGGTLNTGSSIDELHLKIPRIDKFTNSTYFSLFDTLGANTTISNVIIEGNLNLFAPVPPFNDTISLATYTSGIGQIIKNVLMYVDLRLYYHYLIENNLIFDNKGYTDWYIPSIDELSLIFDNRLNSNFSSVIKYSWGFTSGSFFYPMSSSESGSSQVRKFTNYGVYTQPKDPSGYSNLYPHSLILCRNLTGISAYSVGDLYQDTVIIYKDGDSGIGASTTPVLNGYPLFNFNKEDRLLGTQNAVGTGLSNTNKIIASTTNNQSAVKWSNFQMIMQYPEMSLLKTGGQSITIQNCYNHLLNDFSPFSIVNELDVDESLSTSDLLSQNSFTNWDFNTVWELGVKHPQLQNIATDKFTIPNISIKSIERLSSTQFKITINNFSDSIPFGIDIIENGNIIDTINDQDIINYTIPSNRDYNVVISLFYLDDQQKEVIGTQTYYHYFIDQLEPEIITVSPSNTIQSLLISNPKYPASSDFSNLGAFRVHGSILYDGYIYGSPRNGPDYSWHYFSQAAIARININDYTDFDLLEIEAHSNDGFDETVLADFEQIVRIDKYLFTLGGRMDFHDLPENPIPNSSYLVMIDTDLFDYKIFRLSNSFLALIPVFTDGQFLYISGDNGTQKVDPAIFINAPNKYNVVNEFTIPNFESPGWYYNNGSQGGYIDFPKPDYISTSKGKIHSAQADGEFLYLSFTTTLNSGYFPDFMHEGKGICEIHAVRKSDMTPHGWSYIPISTDDMCQTIDWLFFGVEVLSNTNINTYGYGWGAYAIKKSDLISIDHSNGYFDIVKGLPRLHITDNPPYSQSYASLIFGNYLLDFKTNKHIYVIDKSEAEDWSPTENVGQRLLKVLKLNIGGSLNYPGIINEALLDEAGNFHSFLWNDPSGVVKYSISGLSFFLAPTVQTLSAVIEEKNATLRGFIINENGKPVTETGFEYGISSDPDTWNLSIESAGKSSEFSAMLTDLKSGTYYFRAYAINEEGTGYGSVNSFIITSLNNYILFVGSDPVSNVYIGQIPINSFL